MSYAYLQHVPIDADVYGQIKERLGEAPLAGLVVHLALQTSDGKLTYVDVWQSREACDRAFDERIHPAVHATFENIDFTPDGEPQREEVELVDLIRGA